MVKIYQITKIIVLYIKWIWYDNNIPCTYIFFEKFIITLFNNKYIYLLCKEKLNKSIWMKFYISLKTKIINLLNNGSGFIILTGE